eukprot:TRINITY_DN11735_c1_g3_i3.p1 TRINITY_DN11735_c1_g3~~TRINITY_DN11735_c1_g3_i3.p1  ORF type:complete len:220 (+),score=19.84 TRINITY_DN11735_c1_g3_i3:908-1567(+)
MAFSKRKSQIIHLRCGCCQPLMSACMLAYSWTVADVQPNTGLYWYLFTQIFPHYRLFYQGMLQAIIVLLVPVLTAQFWRHPPTLTLALLGVVTIFKPYTTLAEYSIVLTLAALMHRQHIVMRYRLLAVMGLLFGAVLAPTIWHAWIYLGAANPNFYYFASMVIAAAQMMLVSDVCWAQLRRTMLLGGDEVTKAAYCYVKLEPVALRHSKAPLEDKLKEE